MEEFKNGGTVNAIANGASMLAYTWLDEMPVKGDNYYRIKSIGNGGGYKYSTIVKQNVGNGSNSFSVYPNPVTGRIVNIQLNNNQPTGTYAMKIIGKTGQVLYSTVLNYDGGSSIQSKVLPSDIIAGTYHLQLISPEGKISVQNIIVENK